MFVGSHVLDGLDNATRGSFALMKGTVVPVEMFREAAMQRLLWNMTMRPMESVKDFTERY